MSRFEHETISMNDLRAGFGDELLSEAEVIIAAFSEAPDEVVYGASDWEIAVKGGFESELSVVRVEMKAEDEIEDLQEMVDGARSDKPNDLLGDTVDDDDF